MSEYRQERFYAHGADERGAMVLSRKLTRAKLLDFSAGQPTCTVALDACGGAHHWARQLQLMGHQVRLIPPTYGKPFVKWNKSDAMDAEAICEAAPVRELPYWPAAMVLLIKAGQMTAFDYVSTCLNLLLAPEGAATKDVRYPDENTYQTVPANWMPIMRQR